MEKYDDLVCKDCKHFFNLHIDYITGDHNCCNEENCYLCAWQRDHCYGYEQGDVPTGEIRGEWDYERESRLKEEKYYEL